jgi:WD40 repeat protein
LPIGHIDPVTAIAFHPDGILLATADNNGGVVRLRNLSTGRPSGELITGHVGPITAIAFHPDGSLLATGGADATVRLWPSPLWGPT